MDFLGRLQRLDARSVWRHEELDFTPWLCEHLRELSDVLGMDLELLDREVACGDFVLDVLAQDLGSGRKVVIENQLEKTDHEHLGKLLTYAAGLDASAIVWLSPVWRDEFKQALEWLNERTNEETHFFGVAIELLRIDDSAPALDFRVMVEPNEWQKSARAGRRIKSERVEAYREFFQQLIDDLRQQHKFTAARIAQPQSFYSFASGVSGITYGASFATDGRVRADLYIDRRGAAQNKAIFDYLLARRTKFEQAAGQELSWERLDNKQASRVAIYFPGSIDEPPTELQRIRTELITTLLRLKSTFASSLSGAVRAASSNNGSNE